jgi:tRNA 2-selenouridine synthase
MSATVSIDVFLSQIANGQQVILDTRSPAEHERAHIPGAISFPLLNNEERAIIGTTYKKQGREAAVTKGFEMVGPKFADFITQAKTLAPHKEVFVYCWRGGLRSNIMAWLLTTAGFKVTLLKGGYKMYRHWVLAQFHEKKNIVVIGGKTGSGKTELLLELQKCGEQIIDLEAVANHKGSAFGSLGKPQQPFTEHFENVLATQWCKLDATKTIWIENESFKIGTCVVPLALFQQMREAPVVTVVLDYETRKKRILNEYGHFDKILLAEKTEKIRKRLGGLRLKNALAFLDQNDLSAWCDMMLEYYDKTYSHSDALREKANGYSFIFLNDDMKENAKLVLASSLQQQMTPSNLTND